MRLTRKKINIKYRNKCVATNIILYAHKKRKEYLYSIRIDFFNRYIRFIVNKPFDENERCRTIENKEFRRFFNEIVRNDEFQDLIQVMQKYFVRNEGL